MKQRFTYLDIRAISNELCIEPAYIQQVYQHSPKTFTVKLSNKKILFLEIGVRIHLCLQPPETAQSGYFLTKLRTLLRRNILQRIEQVGFDRILRMTTNKHIIFIEFFSGGNVIVTDLEFNILSLYKVVKDIDLDIGKKYVFNPVELDFSYPMFVKGFKDMLSVDKIIYEDIKNEFATKLNTLGYDLTDDDQIYQKKSFKTCKCEIKESIDKSKTIKNIREENEPTFPKVKEPENICRDVNFYKSESVNSEFTKYPAVMIHNNEKIEVKPEKINILQHVDDFSAKSQNSHHVCCDVRFQKVAVFVDLGKTLAPIINQLSTHLSNLNVESTKILPITPTELEKSIENAVTSELLKNEPRVFHQSALHLQIHNDLSADPQNEKNEHSDGDLPKNLPKKSNNPPAQTLNKNEHVNGVPINNQTHEYDNTVQSELVTDIIIKILEISFANFDQKESKRIEVMMDILKNVPQNETYFLFFGILKSFISSEINIIKRLQINQKLNTTQTFDQFNDLLNMITAPTFSKNGLENNINYNECQMDDFYFKDGVLRFFFHLFFEKIHMSFQSCKNYGVLLNAPKINNFIPYKLFKTPANCLEFDSFNTAVLNFFNTNTSKKKEVFKKSEKVASRQGNIIKTLEKDISFIQDQINAVEKNRDLINEIFTVHKRTLASKLDWKDFEKFKKNDKKLGPYIKRTDFRKNLVTVQIPAFIENDADIVGTELVTEKSIQPIWKPSQHSVFPPEIRQDGLERCTPIKKTLNNTEIYHEAKIPMNINDTDNLAQKNKTEILSKAQLKVKKRLQKTDDDCGILSDFSFSSQNSIEVELFFLENIDKNINLLYEAKRKKSEKLEKTTQNIKRVVKSVEKLENTAESKIRRKNLRKKYWFEKFLFTITSNKHLVIAGRSAQENDILVKKYFRNEDLFFHTETRGGSCVVLRDGKVSKDSDVRQAALTALCLSSCWKNRIVQNIYHATKDQVTKQAESGEYLPQGSFMVRGKKTFVDVYRLEYGIGIIFITKDRILDVHNKDDIYSNSHSSKMTENKNQVETNFLSKNSLSFGIDNMKITKKGTDQEVFHKVSHINESGENDIGFNFTLDPKSDDPIDHCLVISGPYEIFNTYKYKIKLLPSNDKKGKHITQILNYFTKKSKGTYEHEWIKQIHSDDVANVLIKDCKIGKTS